MCTSIWIILIDHVATSTILRMRITVQARSFTSSTLVVIWISRIFPITILATCHTSLVSFWIDISVLEHGMPKIMLLIISSHRMGSGSTLSTICGSILTMITKFVTRTADWILISLCVIFHFFPESKWTSSHTVVLRVRSFPRGISIKFEVH